MTDAHLATRTTRPADPIAVSPHRPIVQVIVQAEEVLQTSSTVESIIDTYFDRMQQTNLVLCVRGMPGEPAHE